MFCGEVMNQPEHSEAGNVSDSMCVCGHDHMQKCSVPPWSQLVDCCCGKDADGRDCRCRDFRVALDWPDAEGWWWSGWRDWESCAPRLLFAWADYTGAIQLRMKIEPCGRQEFEKEYGPARFTRLLEPSPFSTPNK